YSIKEFTVTATDTIEIAVKSVSDNPYISWIKIGEEAENCSSEMCEYRDSLQKNWVSVDELEEFESYFSMYPNPANNMVTIELDNTEYTKVELYNISGKLILETDIVSTSTDVDVSKLSSGVYFVRTFGNEISHTKKLIIK
ncbi:MAG: T9SS type A sorting domain-containing protein, partial [Bacteroidales bacterium]|nr:T9SS type A sorting domain-containing protein [Bacteroidales bacterium]